MKMHSRAERLTRRFPDLAAAPAEERPGIVRKAMWHPVVVVFLLVCSAGILPPYLQFMFEWLKVESEQNMLLALAKTAAITFIPVISITHVLGRWVMPRLIRSILTRRGYIGLIGK